MLGMPLSSCVKKTAVPTVWVSAQQPSPTNSSFGEDSRVEQACDLPMGGDVGGSRLFRELGEAQFIATEQDV